MDYNEFSEMLREKGIGFTDTLLFSILLMSDEKKIIETATEHLVCFGDGWTLWLDKKFNNLQELAESYLKRFKELFFDSYHVMQGIDLIRAQLADNPLESSDDMRVDYLCGLMGKAMKNDESEFFRVMCAGLIFYDGSGDKKYLKLFYPEIVQILLKRLVVSRFRYFDQWYKRNKTFYPPKAFSVSKNS